MSSSLIYDLARHRVEPCPPKLSDPAADWLVQVPVLADELAQVSDPRRREGRRYDLVFLLLILVAAVLTGASSISQVLRWARGLPPQTLRVLARGGSTRIPAYATFSRLLSRLDGDEVDDAFSRFTAAVLAPGDDLIEVSAAPEPLSAAGESTSEGSDPLQDPSTIEKPTMEGESTAATESVVPDWLIGAAKTASPVRAWSLDGKTVRGGGTATTRAPHLVSVLRHDTNTVAAQRLVDVKTNEITVFNDTLDVIEDLRGHVVLADALHTQRAHAEYLHGREAYYLFPVAQNQPKLFEAVNNLPWEDTTIAVEETGKKHGRNEKRTTKVLPAPPGLPFPNVRQVILTERLTTGRPGGKTQAVAALSITALPADLASPTDLAHHIRNHWKIEANHHIRDVTYREDQSQARTNSTPRIMASARNQAINLAQIAGFTNIPHANDHYKAHPDQALQLLGLSM